VIACALLAAWLNAAVQDEAPVAGDCSPDAASLTAEARALLAAAGPEPSNETLVRARRLLRAARRLDLSPDLTLTAADLAFLAGDAEEGGDLLAAAADAGPARLSPAELLLLGRRAEQRRRWREAITRYRELSQQLAARGEVAGWIAPRVRELEIEEQAEAIALPSRGLRRGAPRPGRRQARARGGRLRERAAFPRTALDAEPAYVEALLALAALESRAGRSGPRSRPAARRSRSSPTASRR
jgi:hypothetical protein